MSDSDKNPRKKRTHAGRTPRGSSRLMQFEDLIEAISSLSSKKFDTAEFEFHLPGILVPLRFKLMSAEAIKDSVLFTFPQLAVETPPIETHKFLAGQVAAIIPGALSGLRLIDSDQFHLCWNAQVPLRAEMHGSQINITSENSNPAFSVEAYGAQLAFHSCTFSFNNSNAGEIVCELVFRDGSQDASELALFRDHDIRVVSNEKTELHATLTIKEHNVVSAKCELHNIQISVEAFDEQAKPFHDETYLDARFFWEFGAQTKNSFELRSTAFRNDEDWLFLDMLSLRVKPLDALIYKLDDAFRRTTNYSIKAFSAVCNDGLSRVIECADLKHQDTSGDAWDCEPNSWKNATLTVHDGVLHPAPQSWEVYRMLDEHCFRLPAPPADLERPSDQAIFRAELYGIWLTKSRSATKLERATKSALVVAMQPQHILEQVAPSQDFSLPAPKFSGESRLAVTVDGTTDEYLKNYRISSILRALKECVPRVLPNALGQDAAPPRDISAMSPEQYPVSTSIELPTDLFLSPVGRFAWSHDFAAPSEDIDSPVEVWDTSVTSKQPHEDVYLRAVWCKDFSANGPIYPFDVPTPGNELKLLVQQTGEFKSGLKTEVIRELRTADLTPEMESIAVTDFLTLSPMGATLNAIYTAENENSYLQKWIAQIDGGRDQQILYSKPAISLFSGHPSIYTAITTRELDGSGHAILKKRHYFTPRRLSVNYGDNDRDSISSGDGNFGNPFVVVSFKDKNAREIAAPTPASGDHISWMYEPGGTDLAIFTLICSDKSGQIFEIKTPLALLILENQGVDIETEIRKFYSLPRERKHDVSCGGTNLSYVAPFSSANGESDNGKLETNSVRMKLTYSGGRLRPTLEYAQVSVKQLDLVAGGKQLLEMYYDNFSNFDGLGKVFAYFDKGQPKDLLPAMVKTSVEPLGISLKRGLITGIFSNSDSIRNSYSNLASLDPKKLFASQSRLFGKFELGSLLEQLPIENVTFDQFQHGGQIGARYKLCSKLKAVPFPGIIEFKPLDQSKCCLEVEAYFDPATQALKSKVHADMGRFLLTLLNLVGLTFKRLSFDSSSSAKPTFNPDFEKVELLGQLRWVSDFATKISSLSTGGSGGGPKAKIEFRLDELLCSLSTSVRKFSLMGLFTISDMRVGTELALPLLSGGVDNPIRYRFDLSKRDQPFTISVGTFGGGGYFGVALDSAGFKSVELALEFGGVYELDLVVAEGTAKVMAGIYACFSNNNSIISGYLRCVGRLSVLDLIDVTATFLLSLTYQSNPSLVWGEAVITVTIEFCFFSKSVELSVRKEFGKGARALLSPGDTEALSVRPYLDRAKFIKYWNSYAY